MYMVSNRIYRVRPTAPRDNQVQRAELRRMTANEQIISQFRHCRQCRADAVGLVDVEKQIAGKKCVATT